MFFRDVDPELLSPDLIFRKVLDLTIYIYVFQIKHFVQNHALSGYVLYNQKSCVTFANFSS
jgi:hypothetical protein